MRRRRGTRSLRRRLYLAEGLAIVNSRFKGKGAERRWRRHLVRYFARPWPGPPFGMRELVVERVPRLPGRDQLDAYVVRRSGRRVVLVRASEESR